MKQSILLSVCLLFLFAMLTFAGTWQDTTTSDFTAGVPAGTQAINDSIQMDAQSDWWNPAANWWDTAWQYRKTVTIDNRNSSALSDYEVRINNPVYDETGLVGSWHFSEALTDVSFAAIDSSGQSNVGFFGGSNNLAPNSGFETGSPANWTWAWSYAGTSGSWDSVTKYNGGYSVKQTHTVNNQDSVWYGDTSFGSITPGRIYTVSAWVRTNGTGTGGAQFWIGWEDASAVRLANILSTGYYTTNDAWKYVTFTLDGTNVPPANTSRARIHLRQQNFQGDIWYDNVRLTSAYPSRTASGKAGNGLSFDGIDDYVETADAANLRFGLNSAITIESWIYPTDATVTWRSIFQKGGITDDNANYVFRQKGLKLDFFYRGTDAIWHYVQTSSDSLTINVWNHAAVTFIFGQPNTMKLYINGVSVPFVWVQGNGTIAPVQNAQPVRFGGNNFWNQPFTGAIDEVRLYNRALSPDEINAHYNGKPKLDYSDMRFTKSDGTQIPYWFEQDGTFWVKVSGTDSIPAGLSYIYMYYGNAGAVSGSDGTGTFAGFDRFDDMSRWTTAFQPAYTDTTYVYDGTYCAKVRTDAQVEMKFTISQDPFIYEIKLYDDLANKIVASSLPTSGTPYMVGLNRNTTTANYVYRVGSTWYDTGIARTKAWHNLKQAWDGTNITMYIDNSRVYGPAPTTDGVPLNYVFGDYWLSSVTESWFDAFRKRKYAAVEPATISGSETGQSTQWPYRRPLTVSNASSALTDYQIAVKPFSLQRYEETDPACSYTGTWESNPVINHSNGAVKRSLTPGNYAVFTFTGTGAAWIGNKTTNRGIANVYVDDIFQCNVDCYEPSSQFQLALFTKTGLTDTAHTMKIEVTNTKNTASSDYYISIDAFEVYTSSNEDFLNNNGIAASWHFSEDSGNFASDTSGNGNNCVFYSQALKAVYSMTSSGNSYAYIDLNSVTDYTIQSGDYVEYDIYWTSNSDFIAFDYTCSDGTTLRDSGALDQNGVGVHPSVNLTARALNQWYHRKIAIPGGHAGKSIQYYDIACEDNNTASRTAYIRNILITDGADTARKTVYNRGTFTYANHIVTSGAISSMTTNLTDAIMVPAWTSGKYGKGLSFDGYDDYLETPDSPSLDITHAVTLEAWVKPSEYFNVWDNHIVDKEWNAYLLTYNSTGTANMTVYVDGGMRTVSGGSVPLNQWTHVTGTYDSSTKEVRIYTNGAYQNKLTLSGLTSYLIGTNDYTLRIGFYDPGKGVKGLVDEVCVYNRALTDDEILARFNLRQNKLNGDYSDIRFAGANGIEFPFWMETDKTFWVRMSGRDMIPYGSSTIYMYYGNQPAASVSNGNMTFDFFDDFNDGNYAVKWTNPAGAFSEQNGYVQQTSDTGAAANEGTDELRSIAQVPASLASNGFTADISVYSGNSGSWNDITGIFFTTLTSTALKFGGTSSDKVTAFNRYFSSGDNGFGTDYKANWIYTIGDSYISGWNRINAVFKGTSGWELGAYGINDTMLGYGNGINDTALTAPLYIRLHSYNSASRWDNLFVRKSTAIEPVISPAGAEQTPFLTTGTFVSAVKNTFYDDTVIDSVLWSSYGTGTVTLQVRAGNSPIGWTDFTPSWESVTNGDTSVTSKGRYLQYKAVLSGSGSTADPVLTDVTITYTVPVTPPSDSVSCDKLTGTWYSTAAFTFTNDSGFGTEIDRYYYALNNSSSYSFTYTEPLWTSGALSLNAPTDGTWYFHYKPFSPTDTGGTAQDLGPYKYDGTAPAAPVILSPADNSNIASSTTTFVWQPSSDTSGVIYTLQIDYYTSFNAPFIDKPGLADVSYTLTGTGNEILMGNSTYYWRVIAVNGAGTGTASGAGIFTTASSVPQVINETTGQSFSTLQDAIDSGATADGDTLSVNDVLAHNENITLNKDIVLENAVLAPAAGFAVTGQGTAGGEILRNCVITSGGVSNMALGENLTIFDPDPAKMPVIENSTLVNCLIEFGTTITNSTLTNCYIEAAPGYFTDAVNGDFHITGSATGAIDQGKDLSAEFATDIAGALRNKDILEISNFDSGAWDIGAYEYDPDSFYVTASYGVISLNPSGLTYSSTAGYTTAVTKILTISNAGSVDFTWTLSDNSAWLTVSPSSGTSATAADISITADPSGLSAGLYTATITATADGTVNSPLYVPVNLIINSVSSTGDNYALIEVTPAGLNFYEKAGSGASSSKSMVISNSGTLDFNWTITDNADWLTVSPESGIGSDNTTAEVTINLTALPYGTHSADIIITAEGTLNSPVTVPVSVIIYEETGAGNNNTGNGTDNSINTAAPPAKPVLLSPQDGSADIYPAPLLSWSDTGTDNGITYWLQIGMDTGFNHLLENKIVYSTSYQTNGVEFGKVYYWRVKAANSAGMSDWSETNRFQMINEGKDDTGTNVSGCFLKKLSRKR